MKQVLALLLLFYFVFAISLTCTAQTARDPEIIHWWVSGSESAAMSELLKTARAQNINLKETPVKNSYHAKSAALARMLGNTAPTMVQWQAGIALRELYNEGMLRDISTFAKKEHWQEVLPPVIWDNISVDGKVVAAPLTLHGSNWIYGNKKILDEVGIQMVTTWNEFLDAAPQIQKAGYIPLAIGGQPWQERNLFMSVLLGAGGRELYEQVIIDHNTEAMRSSQIIRVFELFRKLQSFTDTENMDRSWDKATRLVIDGKAAFQVMGDWAKGEFKQADMKAGQDYFCSLSPGAKGNFLAVVDSFVMVNITEPAQIEFQQELAQIMMSHDLQKKFNLHKGAIPPRTDTDSVKFDTCSQKAIAIIQQKNNVLPGFNMSNTGAMSSTIRDAIHTYWTNSSLSPKQGAENLARTMEETMQQYTVK